MFKKTNTKGMQSGDAQLAKRIDLATALPKRAPLNLEYNKKRKFKGNMRRPGGFYSFPIT